MKYFFIVLSLLFLVYLLWPAPASVNNFPALPNSLKSVEPGDTYQVPNVAAYYSDNYRRVVMPFYQQQFEKLTNLPFPPLRINYPPEQAYTLVKDQTRSTYLEELVYPLRDSVFVNGYEPFYEDGQPIVPGMTQMVINNKVYNTKVTLKYYPSPLWTRFLTWMGVNVSVVLLWQLSRKFLRHA